MDLSDSQLLQLQIDAMFTSDSAGRIVATNEPGDGPAPRFFLGRTCTGALWRVRYDLPEATVQRLEALAASEPASDALEVEPRHLAAYRDLLRPGGEVARIVSGPAYHFPDILPALPAGVTRITRANLDLLRLLDWDLATLAAGELEAWAPMEALVEDGAAVSLGFSARLTARVAEAGVNTLAAYRGRGYAPTVVSAWAHAIRATGRIPLYSTSWENHASQAVARKLGLIQYGVDCSLW